MKIIREETDRTYNYLAIIYPFLSPEDKARFHMSLTVALDIEADAPSMRGLGQFPYTRQQVEQLRDALDAALVEMDAIEQLKAEGK